METQKKYVLVSVAAKMIGVSMTTIYKYIEKQIFKDIKIKKKGLRETKYVSEDDINNFLENQNK